jgi:hypothetical protein
MAARYTTLVWTTGTILAGSTLPINQPILSSHINICKLKIAPNISGGTSVAQIYKRNSFLSADLLYDTRAFTGTLIDPLRDLSDPMTDTLGATMEVNEGFVAPYDDLDNLSQFHLNILNNDSQPKTYTVTLIYEEVIIAKSGSVSIPGNLTVEGSLGLDIANTAPQLTLTQTIGGAKNLKIAVNANFADLIEKAGAVASLLRLDLANNRVGIGASAPASLLEINSTSIPTLTFNNPSTSFFIGSSNTSYIEWKGIVQPGADNNPQIKYRMGSLQGAVSTQVNFVIRDMANAADRVIIMQDGKLGLGPNAANSNPISSLANTDTLISDTASVSISTLGLAWRIGGSGYIAAFDNSDSGSPNRNGLLVKTATAAADSYLARFEAAGARRFILRASGWTSNEETNILDQTAGLGICQGSSLGGGFSWRVNDAGYCAAFENASNSATCAGLLVKVAGTAGVNAIATLTSGNVARFTIYDDGQMILPDNLFASDAPGRYIQVGRNSHPTLPGAGAINLVGQGGAPNVIWADATGTLRLSGSRPTNSTDLGGVVVGTQASRLKAKNILREWSDPFPALQEILKTRVFDFTYKNGAFHGEQFTGIISDFSPLFAEDNGKSFNPVSSVGYCILAIQALHRLITA